MGLDDFRCLRSDHTGSGFLIGDVIVKVYMVS